MGARRYRDGRFFLTTVIKITQKDTHTHVEGIERDETTITIKNLILLAEQLPGSRSSMEDVEETRSGREDASHLFNNTYNNHEMWVT